MFQHCKIKTTLNEDEAMSPPQHVTLARTVHLDDSDDLKNRFISTNPAARLCPRAAGCPAAAAAGFRELFFATFAMCT